METTNFVPGDIQRTVQNMGNFQGKFNLDKSGFNTNMPGHTSSHDMVLRQQPRTVKKEGAGIGLPTKYAMKWH